MKNKEIIKNLAQQNGHTNLDEMQQKNITISYEKPQRSSDDSVELKKTTKGTSWSIKVYGDGFDAMDRANKLYQQCQEKYGGVE